MEFTEFIMTLGFPPAAAETAEKFWRAGPVREEMPHFLLPEFWETYYPRLGAAAPLPESFARVRAAAEKSPALRVYANLLHDRAFLAVPSFSPGTLRLPPEVLGDDTGALQLLLAMAALPLWEERNRKRGWPEECVDGVARWIGGTIPTYQAAHGGKTGHDIGQTFWLRRSLDGELFRLGRLEFEPQTPPDWLPAVFRQRGGGETVALCRDGWYLDAEGFRTDTYAPGTARAALDYGRGRVRGVPVDLRTGRALPGRTRELPLDGYECLFPAYQTLAGVHIPGGERMGLEAVRESLRAAREFFPRYLHKELAGFCCVSWIFNPDWQAELPDSNLARFQRLANLTPVRSSPQSGLFFVFGRAADDYSAFPADNPMQRAFHRLREKGRRLREGGMFLLPEEIG